MIAAYPDSLLITGEMLLLETIRGEAAPVYPLTGTRIFLDANPKELDAELANGPALILRTRGGTSKASVPVDVPSVQVDCYGVTPQAARGLSLAVIRQMHYAKNVATDGGIFMSAVREGGGGNVLLTPPGVRPFVPVYFRVLTKS